MRPLPPTPFPTAKSVAVIVNKLSLVIFVTNRYSVPASHAHEPLALPWPLLKRLHLSTLRRWNPTGCVSGLALRPLPIHLAGRGKPLTLSRSPAAIAASAHFPIPYTLDAYDFTAIPTLPKQQMLELVTDVFAIAYENIILVGAIGLDTPIIATALPPRATKA